MNSINKNQAEHHREDLRNGDAVGKIRQLVDKAETCFFRTTGPHKTRPMSVRAVDDRGHVWFLAASDSHLLQDLVADPVVELSFQGSSHSDFLFLEGRVALSRDSAKIAELWEPILKNWFTEGQDDPRITVVEVAPTGGYYWDTKHGGVVAGIKMLIGAAAGTTMDDSIEGTLAV